MSLAAIAIGSLLLGQAAPPPSAAPPVEHSLLRSVSPGSEPPALAAPPAAATSPGQAAAPARPNPAAIVGQSLALPADSALMGRPLHLLSLLSLSQDRRRQLELTHAYWRLVGAVANYSFCLQENHRVERLPSVGEGAADLRAARDSLAASLEEAAAEAVTAQHELAGLMSLPADAALPLPADSPHVGLYNTYFREIFAAAAPPLRIRLLDRLLPLRVRAIDAEAAAAQAAEDAVEAVQVSQAGGKASLAAVAAALEELHRRQEALVAAVCRYNHDIADYALNVARPGVSSTDLTAMLIRWPQGDLPLPAADRKVVPASANEPIPTRAAAGSEPADAGRATAAATCAGGAAIAAARGRRRAGDSRRQAGTDAGRAARRRFTAGPARRGRPAAGQIGPPGAGGIAADQAPGEQTRPRRRRRRCRGGSDLAAFVRDVGPRVGSQSGEGIGSGLVSPAGNAKGDRGGGTEWDVGGNAEGDSPIFVRRKSGQSPGPADDAGRMPPNRAAGAAARRRSRRTGRRSNGWPRATLRRRRSLGWRS